MRQTLFYVPPEVFGTPLFGFGIVFWLLLVVFIGTWFYSWHKTDDRQTAIESLPMMIVTLVVVAWVVPAVMEPAGFPIRGYGFCLLLAFVGAGGLLIYRAKKLAAIPPETMFSFAAVVILCGLAGGRLFHVVEYWENFKSPTLLGSVWKILNFAQGGLVVYGGIICGTAGAIGFAIWKKMSILTVLDFAAPALALGIAIGRIGCFLNGCCYGGVCDLPWAVTFPAGSHVHVHQLVANETYLYGMKFAAVGPDSVLVSVSVPDTKKTHATDVEKMIITDVEPHGPAAVAGIEVGSQIQTIGVEYQPDRWVDFNVAARRVVSREEIIHQLLEWQIRYPLSPIRLQVVSVSPDGIIRHGVLPPWDNTVLPVHPTQLYSALNAMVLCGVLLWYGRHAKYHGQVAAMFFGLYAVTRFLMEYIRTDESSFFGTGFTISQNISIVLFIAAVAAWFWLRRFPVREQH